MRFVCESQSQTSHRQSQFWRPGTVRARWHASGSTPCSPSAASPARARAPPQSVRAGRVRLGADGPLADEAEPDGRRGRRADRRAPPAFVSRGGVKLANALDALGIDVAGRCDCLDVGASTGGFTDCLLQRGAARVIALDVGHGQLDWGLRNDPRVTRRSSASTRASSSPARAAVRARAGRRSTSPSSRSRWCCRRSSRCLAERRRAPGAGQAPVRARPRARRQGRGRASSSELAATRCSRSPRTAAGAGLGPAGLRALGPAGAEGEPRDLPLVRDGRTRGRHRGRGARGGAVSATAERATGVRTAVLMTHSIPETRGRSGGDPDRRRARDCSLVATADERAKLGDAAAGLERASRSSRRSRTSAWSSAATARSSRAAPLRRHRVPVFGDQLRHGSGSSPPSSASELDDGLRARVRGRVRGRCDLPGLEIEARVDSARRSTTSRFIAPPHGRGRGARLPARRRGGRARALRRPRRRDAGRLHGLQPRQRRARSSPGGWRATSSASSRRTRSPRGRWSSAPGDVLHVAQRSRPRAGRDRARRRARERELGRGEEIEVRFRDGVARLAQLPGRTSTSRMREKFGQLAG